MESLATIPGTSHWGSILYYARLQPTAWVQTPSATVKHFKEILEDLVMIVSVDEQNLTTCLRKCIVIKVTFRTRKKDWQAYEGVRFRSPYASTSMRRTSGLYESLTVLSWWVGARFRGSLNICIEDCSAHFPPIHQWPPIVILSLYIRMAFIRSYTSQDVISGSLGNPDPLLCRLTSSFMARDIGVIGNNKSTNQLDYMVLVT